MFWEAVLASLGWGCLRGSSTLLFGEFLPVVPSVSVCPESQPVRARGATGTGQHRTVVPTVRTLQGV